MPGAFWGRTRGGLFGRFWAEPSHSFTEVDVSPSFFEGYRRL